MSCKRLFGMGIVLSLLAFTGCFSKAHAAEPTESPAPTTTSIPTPRPTTIAPQTNFGFLDYPCNKVTDKEFDPQRPYPGSPCDTQIPKSWPEKNPISFACGKSLNVEKNISVPNAVPTQELPANPTVDVAYWCDSTHTQACIIKKFDFNVDIDVSGAKIPILGNTEDELDDATQVNQYLLSYLGGSVQQADQVTIDKKDPAAIDRLINFAGPLKKLLSFDSQNKIKTDLVLGPKSTQYHNYIIGCQKALGLDYVRDLLVNTIKINLSTLGNVTNLVAKLLTFPFDQIKALVNLVAQVSNQNLTQDQKIVALLQNDIIGNDIDMAKFLLGMGSNYWTNLQSQVQTISLDAAVACGETDSDFRRLTDMAGHLPPNPASPEFQNFDQYWNEYLKWRGGWTAVNVPILGTINPFDTTSVWASLFQNVPFSTLEDTVSEFTVSVINDPNQQPKNVITGDAGKPITLTISSGDARISVPHVRAINALSSLLQSIINPQGLISGFNQSGNLGGHQAVGDGPDAQHRLQAVGNGNSSVVPGQSAPFALFTSHDSVCDLKDVRINPGDSLYGQSVSAKLGYYQKFTYTPANTAAPNPGGLPTGSRCSAPSQCESNNCLPENLNHERYCADWRQADGQQKTEGRVAVFSKTPLIDNIYEKLVSGSQSIFRRFLHAQNCEPNCTDEERKHYIAKDSETVPAAINASYSGDGTVTAGDKTGGGQIYIPRLGSLFDYVMGAANENFNLQKMLRPKGIGGQGQSGLVSTGGTCQVPQSGLCSVNDPQTQLLANFGDHANEAAQICSRESNGVADAVNDACLANPIHNHTGKHTADYSVGLFQINMLSHPGYAFLNTTEGKSLKDAIAAAGRAGKSCYEAFSNWQDYQNTANYGNVCVVADQVLLNTCVQWFQNPANSVAYARNMSGAGTNWGPWSTAAACHVGQ